MTSAGKHLVDDFQALPESEKREVLARLLEISRTLDHPELSDEQLVESANDLFLEYDRRESAE